MKGTSAPGRVRISPSRGTTMIWPLRPGKYARAYISRKAVRSVRARSAGVGTTGATLWAAAVRRSGPATRRAASTSQVRGRSRVICPPGTRFSALHRARGEAGDEEALQEHEGRDHGHEPDEAGRGHELPFRLVAALEAEEADRDREVPLRVE